MADSAGVPDAKRADRSLRGFTVDGSTVCRQNVESLSQA